MRDSKTEPQIEGTHHTRIIIPSTDLSHLKVDNLTRSTKDLVTTLAQSGAVPLLPAEAKLSALPPLPTTVSTYNKRLKMVSDLGRVTVPNKLQEKVSRELACVLKLCSKSSLWSAVKPISLSQDLRGQSHNPRMNDRIECQYVPVSQAQYVDRHPLTSAHRLAFSRHHSKSIHGPPASPSRTKVPDSSKHIDAPLEATFEPSILPAHRLPPRQPFRPIHRGGKVNGKSNNSSSMEELPEEVNIKKSIHVHKGEPDSDDPDILLRKVSTSQTSEKALRESFDEFISGEVATNNALHGDGVWAELVEQESKRQIEHDLIQRQNTTKVKQIMGKPIDICGTSSMLFKLERKIHSVDKSHSHFQLSSNGQQLSVGTYRSSRLVGQGCFGAVYRVQETKTGAEYALKLFNKEAMLDPLSVCQSSSFSADALLHNEVEWLRQLVLTVYPRVIPTSFASMSSSTLVLTSMQPSSWSISKEVLFSLPSSGRYTKRRL